jgi:PAS domain S-box-containing protein
MTRSDWIERRQSVRRAAEQTLLGLSSADTATLPAEVLVHELLVHKVELEMQVEELKKVHADMEEARDRYLDLYDFAPVGYLTIDREGQIGEVNLTAAAMLGLDRSSLVKCRFARFVAPGDGDRWHRRFMALMDRGELDRQALVLEMLRADGSRFPAFLDCRRKDAADAVSMMRLTLIDIGRIRQAEAELNTAAMPSEGR